MVTVLFSNAQSRYTNGDTSIEVDAKRVDQLVRLLVERYAELENILEHAAVSVDGVIHNFSSTNDSFDVLRFGCAVFCFLPKVRITRCRAFGGKHL